MEATKHGETGKADLRAKVSATIEKAKNGCDSLQDQAVAAAKAADKAVREHPYQTVGIAFGLGLLIGLLVTRRRSD